MADERDPEITASYRELGAEEPPRALDDAILAAGRRGASARPASLDRAQRQRWYAPLATAAILTLAVAVTVHMQREKPEVASPQAKQSPPAPAAAESTARLRMDESLKPPAEAPAPEKRHKQAEAKPQGKAFAPEPKPAAGAPATGPPAPPPSSPVLRSDTPRAANSLARQEDRTARDAAAAARAPAYGSLEAQVQRRAEAPAPAAAAQAPAPRASPAPAPEAAPPPSLAKEREEDVIDRVARLPPKSTADEGHAVVTASGRELERIAALRAAGKHDEADKALAEFRKRFPDYKIPEEMLRRVERR